MADSFAVVDIEAVEFVDFVAVVAELILLDTELCVELLRELDWLKLVAE